MGMGILQRRAVSRQHRPNKSSPWTVMDRSETARQRHVNSPYRTLAEIGPEAAYVSPSKGVTRCRCVEKSSEATVMEQQRNPAPRKKGATALMVRKRLSPAPTGRSKALRPNAWAKCAQTNPHQLAISYLQARQWRKRNAGLTTHPHPRNGTWERAQRRLYI